MDQNGVCAVVITFWPKPDILKNLAKVRPQVQGLVVVDNGSPAETLAPLREASVDMGFELLENDENIGIGAALNIGVRAAISNGFQWVVLFDQDSVIDDGFVEALLASYGSDQDRPMIAMVAPVYRNPKTLVIYKSAFIARDGAPLEVMSSGSLIPVSTFKNCGWFREDFFIDQVDHEFSFRVRDKGRKIVLCEEAILLHAPGDPKESRLWRWKNILSTHHRAERRYYMTRNGLIMAAMYWKSYPRWSFSTVKALLVGAPLNILLVESDRVNKIFYVVRGLIDAIFGRMGKRVNI
jgi:rhamnosyltransferase